MADWIDIAELTDFPPDTWRVVSAGRLSVLVFHRPDGHFYAIENLCTHDGGTLSEGWLEGDDIVCPRHGARFCVKTGAVTRPPAYEDVSAFPVRVENGKVQLKVNT